MAKLEVQGLAHAYVPAPAEETDWALKPQLDVTFEDGVVCSLLGPSGCGKTTLLNALSGLLQPSQGRILFDGRDVTSLLPRERNIAQVFQFPVVYDTMTVRENLAFPLVNRGVDPVARTAQVAMVADLLDLGEMLDRKAEGLTAAVKQKIALGRGLTRNDVSAILFDEPLSVIDPHIKWLLRASLKRLCRQVNFTMVYVTHDQTEALTFADRIIVMYDGRIVQIGTPLELFERPAHTFVGYFIGSPGMNILPCKIAANTVRLSKHRIPVAPFAAPDGAAELGVRPEHVRFVPAAEGMPARVRGVHHLGHRCIIDLEVAGLQIKMSGTEGLKIPAQPHIGFEESRTRVYVGKVLAEEAAA